MKLLHACVYSKHLAFKKVDENWLKNKSLTAV